MGFRDGAPVVKFYTDDEDERLMKREKFSLFLGEQMITRVQFPLVLAWAISIHKSQGMSLDLATVRIGLLKFVLIIAHII